MHDDLVQCDFIAAGANELLLADISEHHTLEGKLYVCAIKDLFAGRIIGYSIDSRMKSSIAVNALNSAVARRRCCWLRASFRSRIAISKQETRTCAC